MKPLTPRHTEMIVLIALGYSDKQISGRLQISVKTIHKHVGECLRRLGAKNRPNAVYLMMRENKFPIDLIKLLCD